MSKIKILKHIKRINDKISLRSIIINGSSFLLIPMIFFAIPVFISSTINRGTNTNKNSGIDIRINKIEKPEYPKLSDQNDDQASHHTNNLRYTKFHQTESSPTPTDEQTKKKKPTNTPKPTSTPIPTPPPSDPSINNLMAIFGILIVVVIIFGIWVNWRRVFR